MLRCWEARAGKADGARSVLLWKEANGAQRSATCAAAAAATAAGANTGWGAAAEAAAAAAGWVRPKPLPALLHARSRTAPTLDVSGQQPSSSPAPKHIMLLAALHQTSDTFLQDSERRISAGLAS